MSDSFLVAAVLRAKDVSEAQRGRACCPSAPDQAAHSPQHWSGGLHEVESFDGATSSATGNQALVITADGSKVLTRCFCGDDVALGIYSIDDGSALDALRGHADMISALSLDGGDRMASAAVDGTMCARSERSEVGHSKALSGAKRVPSTLTAAAACGISRPVHASRGRLSRRR